MQIVILFYGFIFWLVMQLIGAGLGLYPHPISANHIDEVAHVKRVDLKKAHNLTCMESEDGAKYSYVVDVTDKRLQRIYRRTQTTNSFTIPKSACKPGWENVPEISSLTMEYHHFPNSIADDYLLTARFGNFSIREFEEAKEYRNSVHMRFWISLGIFGGFVLVMIIFAIKFGP